MTPKADAPQNAAFAVTANTQLCSDDGCAPPVPSQTEISLAAGDGAPAADWDSAALQFVAGITPAPEGLTATQTDKDVTITFPADSVPTVAHFFSDDNCVTPTSEQKIDPATGSLTIARNDDKDPMHPTKDHNMVGKPLSKISGILVADDKAYESSLPLASAAAASSAPAETTVPEFSGGMGALFLSLFLGGLILNLMPC